MSEEIHEPADTLYSIAASAGFPQSGASFAARQSGLYRSMDGGKTWEFALDSLELTEVVAATCVTLSPDFEKDGTLFAGAPGGVVRSQDGGKTFQVAGLGSPPPFVSMLAVSPNFEQDGTLWAATMEDGVFCSTTRGNRWALWNFGLLDLNVYALAVSPAFAQDETIYTGTETGIFRSTNGGRAWREVAFPMDMAPVLAVALSPDYGADGTLYVGTEEHGLYLSTDRGKNWERLGRDLILQVNAVAAGPQGQLMVISGDRLVSSSDGGLTWQERYTPSGDEDGITALALPQGIKPGATVLAGLSDGSVKILYS